MTTLLHDAQELAGDLAQLRHRLHRQPELGLDLPRTQDAVLGQLDGLGLEITTGKSSTSVTAVLRGSAPTVHSEPPVVLLRGDMDALPVHEEVDLPFRSQVDGVMHACGHDLHTAMLVGAAQLLAAHRDRVAGDVVLMFQPGEEGYDGASHMIAEGVLDAAGRRPDAAFALHVLSNLTSRGVVASRPGPIMAASDGLFVTVRGRGGHGSAPHGAQDPVPAACEMVLALQTAMTRQLDPFATAVLTVGTFHAGTRPNIIPETVAFEATVRTFDPAVRAVIARAAEQVCRGVAAAHGVSVEVRFAAEYPVTVNDPAETRFALDVADALFGDGATLPLGNPVTGSEDFSRVIAEVPGSMLFLGAVVDGYETMDAPSNHAPRAAFDDRVLPLGAALYAELALSRLTRS
ncbi:MAG TPA: M20 family metallopeptidase [Kineosporiaceae bacterium]